MNFSPLQQYILKECYTRVGKKINRKIFVDFYAKTSKVKNILRTKIITKSIERLIEREMLMGYGVRTAKKWFISEIKMTVLGRKKWQKFLNRKQKKLPI